MTTSQDAQNLASVLDVHAATRGTHEAIVDGRTVWRYCDLARRVRCQAVALAARGVGRGDLVGLGMRDCADHVAAMFALARLGAILLPMDSRWGPAETKQVVAHFRPHLVIRDDPEQLDGTTVLESRHLAAEADAADPATAPDPVEDPDLPLLISLSSGTTGRPKGPAITHRQMLHRFVNQTVSLSFDWYDRFVVATPLYFGGGRTFALSYLYLGGTILLFPPPYKPEELAAAMAEFRPTAMFLVPTLIRRMLALDETALAPFRALRMLISSGAPLFAQEREAVCTLMTPNFFEYYASTEGGGVTVLAPQERPGHETTVGRPAFRVELQVVDDDHLPLPPGEVGRIRYRGPGVATGLFRDPEADRDSFRDGWFYPGDLGAMDADGFLSLRGRSKDMIIRGGANVYPVEIEQTIAEITGVRDVAIVGLPDSEMGEEICAVVVADDGVTEDDIRAACQKNLAAYKVPRRIQFTDELPRNSAGKVLKPRIVESLT